MTYFYASFLGVFGGSTGFETGFMTGLAGVAVTFAFEGVATIQLAVGFFSFFLDDDLITFFAFAFLTEVDFACFYGVDKGFLALLDVLLLLVLTIVVVTLISLSTFKLFLIFPLEVSFLIVCLSVMTSYSS